ncbi:MAG TPA: ABC transporter substrate-binding protein [Mycobacteriales bacterium]|jgi:iron complex transport system substrate-binding protein|nr:transporter substrate-binding protein [Mycobacterium sp.]
MSPRPSRRLTLLLVAAVTTVLTACGGNGNAPATGAAGAGRGFPVTVEASGASVTIDSAPRRIVSLSPTATEGLFAVGAGKQVVAVDDQSTYPAEAPRTKLSGFQPNAEAVAGYSPDLVVLSNDSNGLVAALRKLGVTVLMLPAATTLDEGYRQLQVIGDATGHHDRAAEVVSTTKKRIDAAVASVPPATKGLKVYHELDQTFFSATSRTFVGAVYARFGLRNIADAVGGPAKDYPQLSAEFVVKSAPDVIVLADTKCCGQNAATLAKRPAFASVPAVRTGTIVLLDDDLGSRWGPRVADLAETVARVLAARKG